MLDDSDAEKWREAVLSFLEIKDTDTQEIYGHIEAVYPDLCEDYQYSCPHEREVERGPEWEHKIRSALEQLKCRGKAERSLLVEGEWRAV